jgi:hypothetical protein
MCGRGCSRRSHRVARSRWRRESARAMSAGSSGWRCWGETSWSDSRGAHGQALMLERLERPLLVIKLNPCEDRLMSSPPAGVPSCGRADLLRTGFDVIRTSFTPARSPTWLSVPGARGGSVCNQLQRLGMLERELGQTSVHRVPARAGISAGDGIPGTGSAPPAVPRQCVRPADRRAIGSSSPFGLGIASPAKPGAVPGQATANHGSVRRRARTGAPGPAPSLPRPGGLGVTGVVSSSAASPCSTGGA